MIRTIATAAGWLAVLMAAGCARNPYLATSGASAWAPQPQPVMPIPAGGGVPIAAAAPPAASPQGVQLAELNRRLQLLDDNNRQLTTQLAQSEQRTQVYVDELQLVRQQLADTASQVEAARIAANQAQSQVQAYQASTTLRGGATIQPNTNLGRLASRLQLGTIPVIPDGNSIRVSLPPERLFAPGSGQMYPTAESLIAPIATQLRTVFPRQRIDVEVVTDAATASGANPQSVSAARAGSLVQLLTTRAGLPDAQLSGITRVGPAASVELIVRPELF